MIEPKLEVPAELRDLAEKTIDQAEKAFGMFFDAAAKSMASVPSPGTEISKQALNFTEQNMRAAVEHARKLVHATDLQEALRIQSEFVRSQFTSAGEHMRQMTGGVMSAAVTSPAPDLRRYMTTGSSCSEETTMPLRLRMISVMSSVTPSIVENSWRTESTLMLVTEAPGIELRSVRRSELPSV